MKLGLSAFVLAVAFIARLSHAQETSVQVSAKEISEIAKSTKMHARMGLDKPASEFRSDGDPTTLEIVFLSKPEDGPSRVAEDGEVIFQQEGTSDKEQQQLLKQAFGLRAIRARGK